MVERIIRINGCRNFIRGKLMMTPMSSRSYGSLVTFLFCLFLGQFGIHRFYVGKRGTGVLMLLTGGGLGIWYLYDLLSIVCNNFTDRNGHLIELTKNPSFAKKTFLVILSICSAFLVFFTWLFIIFMILMFILVGRLDDVAQHQLAAIRSSNFEKAYSYTSSQFQKEISFDSFKNFIEAHPELKNNINASFPLKNIKNNEVSLEGTLKAPDKTETSIYFRLIKENNQWKVLYIESPSQSSSLPNTSALKNMFENKEAGYSIKYPFNWDYDSAGKNIIFSGRKGSPDYYSTVNIEVIPTKKSGGKYENLNEFINSIKKQALSGTQNLKILAEESGDNLKLFSHDHMEKQSIKMSYDYHGQRFERLQIVFLRQDNTIFYSFAFTAPIDRFETVLPIAKAMFATWVIQ